ncbi:MAG TPA: methionyl-tRNA formyltransferase [Mycobacteriales bacterium]
MRLVFAGTPAAAVPSLAALVASDRHEVVGVITRPDAPAGRGKRLAASPVKEFALEHGIPVLTPDKARDVIPDLEQLRPDCCPVVAYGKILPQEVLQVPPYGFVNLHFSLLPAHRGAAPVQHVLLAGDDVTGATTFLLDDGMDTGPVLGMFTETVRPTDTSGDLLDRLAEGGAGLLTATLDALEDGQLRAEPQQAEGISYAPKLTADDAHVDWSRPAAVVDRTIRACTPAPGPWTTLDGARVKLGPVRPVDSASLAPGEIGGALVGTGQGDVRLSTVQPAGKGPIDAAAWLRGARLAPDARFGT